MTTACFLHNRYVCFDGSMATHTVWRKQRCPPECKTSDQTSLLEWWTVVGVMDVVTECLCAPLDWRQMGYAFRYRLVSDGIIQTIMSCLNGALGTHHTTSETHNPSDSPAHVTLPVKPKLLGPGPPNSLTASI